MKDIYNVPFIIKQIEDMDTYKTYVMNPTPNLHCGCPTIIDDDGIEYTPECVSMRKVPGEEELVEYLFEFDTENDPYFPVGKTFSRKLPEWIKTIPDSRIIKIDYESQSIIFGENKVVEQINITVNKDGEVWITRGKSLRLSEERSVRFQITEEDAGKLLEDMLRCVSGPDCYKNQYVDDTARQITYHFENGYALKYDGVYAYGNKNEDYQDTVKVMSAFKEKCTTNVYRSSYSFKSVKELFSEAGARVGEVAERLLEKRRIIYNK